MYLGREVSVGQQNSTLVLSLDFDGCTDTFESRERLIDAIHAHCLDNPQYTEIIVLIGSLRQSVFSDLFNATMHSSHFAGELLSCTILLSEFVDRLSAKLNTREEEKIRVIPDPLLTSDIYNDLEPGTTVHIMKQLSYQEFIGIERFQYIPVCDAFGNNVSNFTKASFQEWYNSYIKLLDEGSKSIFLSDWGITLEEFTDFVEHMDTLTLPRVQVTNKIGKNLVVIEKTGQISYKNGDLVHFDDTDKTLSLYIITQHLARKYAKPFDLIHVDDRVDLLAILECFFIENQHAIPAGSSFRRLEWNVCSTEATFGTKILGIGSINPHYIQDAKMIADRCLKAGVSSSQYMPLRLQAHLPERETVDHLWSDLGEGKIIRPKAVRPTAHARLNLFAETVNAVHQKDLPRSLTSASIDPSLT